VFPKCSNLKLLIPPEEVFTLQGCYAEQVSSQLPTYAALTSQKCEYLDFTEWKPETLQSLQDVLWALVVGEQQSDGVGHSAETQIRPQPIPQRGGPLGQWAPKTSVGSFRLGFVLLTKGSVVDPSYGVSWKLR
jgi:hypothetical protein